VSREGRTQLNGQINEEAARWFVEFRSGDIDAAGRRAFDAWVRASPEHLRAFIEIAALWRHSAAVNPRGRFSLEELVASVEEAGNVVRLDTEVSLAEERDATSSGSSSSVQTPPSERRFSGKGFRIGSIAAAAVLLVASSIIVGSKLLERDTYRTEVGEHRSLRLSDGSMMTLNSRSRAKIAFTDSTRKVDLVEGQALFHVAKNASRPFVVRTAGALVRAVGTEFDVDNRNSGTVITVVEGRVAVSAAPAQGRAAHADGRPDATVFLSAGEQIAVVAGVTGAPTRTNVSSATAWMHRKVILQSATLAEVAERFNRYSERPLVAEDHGAVPFRLSGVFSTDPDFLIHYLDERADIQVHESATEIRIIRTEVH
jgi:transmembrane sensor